MTYRVEYSQKALRLLKKMDKLDALILASWIQKNLMGIKDPYSIGKPLAGNKKGQWRYRVGSYRLLAKIEDDKLPILIIGIGHRRDIYQ